MRDWLRDIRDQAVCTVIDALAVLAFVGIGYVTLFVWAGAR